MQKRISNRTTTQRPSKHKSLENSKSKETWKSRKKEREIMQRTANVENFCKLIISCKKCPSFRKRRNKTTRGVNYYCVSKDVVVLNGKLENKND